MSLMVSLILRRVFHIFFIIKMLILILSKKKNVNLDSIAGGRI